MKPGPRTNIIMTCWNALEYTKATLDRLVEATECEYYLTVIDNGSTDGTRSYLQDFKSPRGCKKLTVITNTSNRGLLVATNQGYEVSINLNAEFSCLCNNDLYFPSGWLGRLQTALDNNPRIGILAPMRPTGRFKHFNGLSTGAVLRATPQDYGWREELKFFTGRPLRLFNAAAQEIVKANGGGIQILETPPDAVSTCCALVRNAAVEKLGWLADIYYYNYGSDDVDLCWSIAAQGYQCAVLKDVYVHHFRSKSIKDNKVDSQRILLENSRRFFDKWSATIYDLLKAKIAEGANLSDLLNREPDGAWWFLYRNNDDIHFWTGTAIDEQKFKTKQHTDNWTP